MFTIASSVVYCILILHYNVLGDDQFIRRGQNIESTKTQSDTIELEITSFPDKCAVIFPSSNCLRSRPSDKGCDTKLCEDAVCKCDPYCCGVGWDSSCVEGNYFSPGCTANKLCCILYQPAYGDFYTRSDTMELEIINPTSDSCASISPSSNCLQSQTSDKGCDTKSCEDAVCKCDPYCCQVTWDSHCVEENSNFPGCSAKDLCCVVSEAATGSIMITLVPKPSDPVGDADFGGKKYKVDVSYSASSCYDLLCVDSIIIQNFPEISTADGIILEGNLREDMGLSTKTLAWAGEVKNGIGSANFLQMGDDLMGNVSANGYDMQFSTVNGIMYVDVIPQGNFPND